MRGVIYLILTLAQGKLLSQNQSTVAVLKKKKKNPLTTNQPRHPWRGCCQTILLTVSAHRALVTSVLSLHASSLHPSIVYLRLGGFTETQSSCISLPGFHTGLLCSANQSMPTALRNNHFFYLSPP